jgi:hypothetical protein
MNKIEGYYKQSMKTVKCKKLTSNCESTCKHHKIGCATKPYPVKRIFLETLFPYIEAAKVKLLTEFTENAER